MASSAKRKKHIIIISSIAILLIALISAAIYAYFTLPISFGGKGIKYYGLAEPNTNLSSQQTKDDAQQMVTLLEEVHPMFLEPQSAAYQANKKAYLDAANKPMTVAQFRIITSTFLTTIGDGHTCIFWSEENYLNFKNIPEDAEIISVGGVGVEKIDSVIDRLFPCENESARKINYKSYIYRESVLEAAGVNCSDRVKVEYKLYGKTESDLVVFTDSFPGEKSIYKQSTDYTEKDGAFIITMHSCKLDSSLYNTAAALKKAVAGGTTKVVVDLRDNGGGNSQACDKIFDALKMKHGVYGQIVRFSKPTSVQSGFIRNSGSLEIKPDNSSVPNKKISLYVLTNANTFSSANMFAVWVRDGNLGKIVGQPPSNVPSHYGDTIGFQLKNSKLTGQMSFKKFTRPDASKKDEKELVPDILVPDEGDALAVALNQK